MNTVARQILSIGCVLLVATHAPGQTEADRREVIALYQQAEKHLRAGKFADAARVYEQVVPLSRTAFGPDHGNTINFMNNLGFTYFNLGRYEPAEKWYTLALRARERTLGKDHADVGASLNNLALLYKETARYAQAEEAFVRSIAIKKEKLERDHPSLALSLHNLALLYNDALAQHHKAEKLYLESARILEAKLGKDHPNLATCLNNLGKLYHNVGRHAEARKQFERSLAIRRARLPRGHYEIAVSLANLGHLDLDQGQFDRAIERFEEAGEILEGSLGQQHPFVATNLTRLGDALVARGRIAQGERVLRRSLAIYETVYGKEHVAVAHGLWRFAILEAGLGRPGPAAEGFDRGRRLLRRHVARVLPAFSEAEQASFLDTEERTSRDCALSLGLLRASDPATASRSACWLLNSKGLAQEALAQAALISRDSRSPEVAKLTRQLLAIRQDLARLSCSAPRSGQEKQRQQRFDELLTEEADLGKKVRRAGGSLQAGDPWIELADVRKTLPRDTVLVDFARFAVRDFKAAPGKLWQSARYAAWITRAEGDVEVVDLGPASKIDEAVQAVRQGLEKSPALILDKGEAEAEKQLRERLSALSALILRPMLSAVGKKENWLICPDGNLWLVPFEALLLPDGKYVVEKHTVGYLNSPRDLLREAPAGVKVQAPVILADPDYDLTPMDAREEAKRLAGTDRPVPPHTAGLRSLGNLRLGSVKRLEWTGAEAKAITPSLKRYADAQPRVYTRRQALEDVFKSVRNPKVVVLATHGYFSPDPGTKNLDGAAVDPLSRPRVREKWDHPLLRCGLLLAGCNQASESKGGEDGVLTGLEVVGVDLRGCELVVLSACETGLGKIQTGEGISGLRQAFQLAGAQAVVSTLWQVPDRQSARLMHTFFTELAGGKSRATALCEAKRKQIEQRRDDTAAAHPFFWAAFTLTGR